VITELKSVTLTFYHQINKADYGELMVLPVFSFGESSHFVTAFVPFGLLDSLHAICFAVSPSCDIRFKSLHCD
jgi:hypothetical protein